MLQSGTWGQSARESARVSLQRLAGMQNQQPDERANLQAASTPGKPPLPYPS